MRSSRQRPAARRIWWRFCWPFGPSARRTLWCCAARDRWWKTRYSIRAAQSRVSCRRPVHSTRPLRRRRPLTPPRASRSLRRRALRRDPHAAHARRSSRSGARVLRSSSSRPEGIHTVQSTRTDRAHTVLTTGHV